MLNWEQWKYIILWIYAITITIGFITMIILYVQKHVGVDTCVCQVCKPDVKEPTIPPPSPKDGGDNNNGETFMFF